MSNETEPKTSQIYAQGYEKWDGERGYSEPVWFLIGKTVLRNVTTPTGCLSRLILIFLFIIPIGIYYFGLFAITIGHFQLKNLENSERFQFLAEFVKSQNFTVSDLNQFFSLGPSMVFVPMAMIFFGAQLISKDKQANALQVYFSKAVSRMDYVLGKFFAVGVMTAMVTLIPCVVILVLGLVFTTDHQTYFLQAWHTPILSLTFWLFLTLLYGSITLVFSSFFDKSYMAAVGIIGFLVFCMVFSQIAIVIFGATDMLNGLNWYMSTYYLGTSLFNLDAEYWGPLIWRILDAGAICALAIYFIFKKINPIEVIK